MTAIAAPLPNERGLFGHPRGLALLFAVEMWERFSYYGMRALLVLYLVNALGWSDGDAARLYGNYTSLVWLTPIIGGYLADRWLGTRRSMIIGALVITLGHFLLALQTMPLFYAGLACVIIGTGFFKPNVSTQVGQLYRAGDPRRDAGFTIFYMGINLGATIAPLVCGYLGERIGWHFGFGAAGVGMLLGLLMYLRWRAQLLPGIGLPPNEAARSASADYGAPPPPALAPVTNNARLGAIGAAAGAAITWLASGANTDLAAWIGGGGWVQLILGICVGGALAISVLGTHGDERRRVSALFIVSFFVVFFWMAFEQAGSSMNIFADRYTDREVGTFQIPASWFQSVNATFIILFAPAFAWLWRVLASRNREPSTPLKMVLGLVLVGLGFVFLVIGARTSDACAAQVAAEGVRTQCQVASPSWLILAYLMHSWGELCLSPVGLSYVTKIAPARLVSLLMGVFFLSNALAQYFGGLLAAQTENVATQSAFFSIPVATSWGAALVMLAVVPFLKRLTAKVPV
ncbi:MAG: peptide MFS transporter [Gemmatimonadaceae bacterium]